MHLSKTLQAELIARLDLMCGSDFRFIDREVGYFCAFLKSSPLLSAITELIERSHPEIDDKWLAAHVGTRGINWPPTEPERAKAAWMLISAWAAGKANLVGLAKLFTFESNFNAMSREVVAGLCRPFVFYLLSQLGGESNILYLLERYRRRVEWFEQQSLYDEYQAAKSKGEKVYEHDLQRFLFDQGIDYPFSQPRSATGKADLVADLDKDDPLVCEIKLFDGDDYGPSYLSQGVNQALAYARDYGKPAGHLVVFNLTQAPLQLPSDDEQSLWPPRLHVAGRTIFLVVVQARPVPAPSVQGPVRPRVLERSQLVRAPE